MWILYSTRENWITHSDPAVMGLDMPGGAVSIRRLTLITFYLHDSSGDGSLTAIKYEAMVHFCARQSNQTFGDKHQNEFWQVRFWENIDTY